MWWKIELAMRLYIRKRNTTPIGVMTLDGALTYSRTSTVAVVAPTPRDDVNSLTTKHLSNDKLPPPALPLCVGSRRDLHLGGATPKGGTPMKQAEVKQTVLGKFSWWLCTPTSMWVWECRCACEKRVGRMLV